MALARATTSRWSASTTSPTTRPRSPAQVRLDPGPPRRRGLRRRPSRRRGKTFKAFAERDPANAAVGRPRRRRRARVDRPVHRRDQGQGAPRRRRQEGHHLRAGQERGRHRRHGVNHGDYDPAAHTIISNASCTTNCLAPMAKVLHDAFGIQRGLMTTIHAYTRTRTCRTARTRTCAAPARRRSTSCPPRPAPRRRSAWCCPQLKGKLDGYALRVPMPTGSATDLTVTVGREATVEEVNAAIKAAGDGPLKGILEYTEDPIVSADIVTDPASCIFDAGLTKVIGNQVKVVGWYDNEWGYSNRLVDLVTLRRRSAVSEREPRSTVDDLRAPASGCWSARPERAARGRGHHRRRPDPGQRCRPSSADRRGRPGRRLSPPGPTQGRGRPEVLAGAGGAAARRTARRPVRSPPTRSATARSGVAALATAAWRCWRTCASNPRRPARTTPSAARSPKRLAALAEAYVDDGFGAVHRKHASVYDVAQRLPHARAAASCSRGRGAQRLTEDPDRPYVVVLGGSKVSDKLAVIDDLLARRPAARRRRHGLHVPRGPGPRGRVVAARGGSDRHGARAARRAGQARRRGRAAGRHRGRGHRSPRTPSTTWSPADAIPADRMGLDIGRESGRLFAAEARRRPHRLLERPDGRVRVAPFAEGTRAGGRGDRRASMGSPSSAAATRRRRSASSASTRRRSATSRPAAAPASSYLEGKLPRLKCWSNAGAGG